MKGQQTNLYVPETTKIAYQGFQFWYDAMRFAAQKQVYEGKTILTEPYKVALVPGWWVAWEER